jgi:hypothetical protein
MYESPIRLLVQQSETSIREQQEKQIFEAVQKCGVDVDREELIKALAYDRAQYAQGYSDGRADAQRWISVKERLPEKGQQVAFIPSCNHGSVYVGVLTNIGKSGGVMFSHREGRYKSNYYAKYWMPLPEPPKEE